MIREATDADAETLASLLFRCPQPGHHLLIRRRRHDVFSRRRIWQSAVTLVADAGGRIQGAGTAALKTVLVRGQPVLTAYVFDLAVDPAARGQGLGRQLVDELGRWAHRRDVAFLYAHILGGNTASEATFGGAGYTPVARLVTRAYPLLATRRAPAGETGPALDWGTIATLLHSTADDLDLVPQQKTEELRTRWTSLSGWRADDIWSTQDALLGLWDQSAVAETTIMLPLLAGGGRPVTFGYLLGGVGSDATLRRLFGLVRARARSRGFHAVLFSHDARHQPRWSTSSWSLAARTQLFLKPAPGAAPPVPGGRPVWVDPLDF